MTSEQNQHNIGLFKVLFETATEGIIVANVQGIIELANERSCEIFGYPPGALIGVNVDQLLPEYLRPKHKEYRKHYSKNPHKRPMGKGLDLIGRRKDGSSVPVEISLNHFGQGPDMKVAALIMDVTERKEQEAQILLLNKNLEKRVEERTRELIESQHLYKLIARNFPGGTINVLDRNFNYEFVEGQDLYRKGITSERLVGSNYIDRLPEDIRDIMRQKLADVLSGSDQSFEMSYRDQHYLINAVGLKNKSGKTDKILLVEQNITDRKLAEERTKLALEKERQLNELKSRFVSMASHEFRTPLSGILSSLSLLERYDQLGRIDDKPKHYARIRGAVRHLTSILNDFLSLEKVESGNLTPLYSTFDASQVVAEITEQLQETAKPGQSIVKNVASELMVKTDQTMLRVIISNLLSNAIKYSDNGTEIRVTAAIENDALKITVTDRGIGIPMDEQKHLFDRFFRASNAANREGTGLGMHIVKKYVDLLQGKISFRSQPGEGTTFQVYLPIHDQHADHIVD
ncbi:MAG: hypothetical protein Kow0075_04860 [Salibacteraceae bacterium]